MGCGPHCSIRVQGKDDEFREKAHFTRRSQFREDARSQRVIPSELAEKILHGSKLRELDQR